MVSGSWERQEERGGLLFPRSWPRSEVPTNGLFGQGSQHSDPADSPTATQSIPFTARGFLQRRGVGGDWGGQCQASGEVFIISQPSNRGPQRSWGEADPLPPSPPQ